MRFIKDFVRKNALKASLPLLAGYIVLSGCNGYAPKTQTTPMPTSYSETTYTRTPASTPKPTPRITRTPQPTATPLPTSEPIPPAPEPTAASIPTPISSYGSVSGIVTDENSGAPIAGIRIYARGPVNKANMTDSTGYYTIQELPPGEYAIQFHDEEFPLYHVDEWYSSAVIVNQGQEIKDVNAALVLGGSISGMVTDKAGSPLENVCVEAHDSSSGQQVGSGLGYLRSGKYTLGGLPAGDYKIRFWDCGGQDYAWYDNKQNFESADLVAVTKGSDTSDINAAITLQ